MRVKAPGLLLVAEAARRIGLSPQGMTAAVRTGRIPAFCFVCGNQFGKDVLDGDRAHFCVRDPDRQGKSYAVGLRPTDVDRFEINRGRQANGRKSHRRTSGKTIDA